MSSVARSFAFLSEQPNLSQHSDLIRINEHIGVVFSVSKQRDPKAVELSPVKQDLMSNSSPTQKHLVVSPHQP